MKIPKLLKSRTFLVIALMVGARASLADWYVVPSGSMNPTIQEGDYIFVNKLAYGSKLPFTDMQVLPAQTPSRGDVVVFFKQPESTRMVKRVIGIPGDTVELQGNSLTINGQLAEYTLIESTGDKLVVQERLGSFVHEMQTLPNARSPQSTTAPIIVPEGKLLVMGDNRDNSFDSRFFGLVDQTDVVGKALGVVASFSPDSYLPRVERIGKSF